MVDVARMPEKAFGYVPTPALVAPIEFTLRARRLRRARRPRLARRRRCEDGAARPAKVRHRQGSIARRCAAPRRLSDGRLHLQHGPIDLIIEAFGAPDEVEAAYRQAVERFGDILPTLVARAAGAAPAGRRRLSAAAGPGRAPHGRGRVAASRRLHHADGRGRRRRRRRDAAGDAAPAARSTRPTSTTAATSRIHLAPGHSLRAGIFAQALDGAVTLTHDRPVRGIATSGCGGRSLLARHRRQRRPCSPRTAAAADAAATLIANAVDIDHPAIERRPARELDPDSDSATCRSRSPSAHCRATPIERRSTAGCGSAPAAAPRPDRQRGLSALQRQMASMAEAWLDDMELRALC